MNPDLQLYERIPDKYVKHSEDFDPNNYLSIQDRVNSDPDFEKAYIENLIQKGWVKVKNVADIIYYPPGESFKYRLNGNSLSKAEEGTFRSGGFLIGKPLDSNDYILYKAFNGSIFPLQLVDIMEVYVKDPKAQLITFNYPHNITNNPVYLPHPVTGDPVVVYYGKKPKESRNFQLTQKFMKATKYGNWAFKNIDS